MRNRLRGSRLDIMSTGLPSLRRQRRLTALVLPALVLRALIPFGFMPIAASGGPSIGLCPGTAGLPPGIVHTHGSHAGTGGDGAGTIHHAPCLYAASSTIAGAPAAAVLAFSAPPTASVDAGPAACIFSPTILRAQGARAPPALT